MSADSIDQSISELQALLALRCPVLAPAVFPSQYCPKDLQDLCSTQEQRDIVTKWAAKKGAATTTSVRFMTDIRQEQGVVAIKGIHIVKNNIEGLLGNLEGVMNMLAQASKKEVGITCYAFSEANSGATDADDSELQHRSFVEAYNIAYAIKVLLSNMPIALKLQVPKGGKSSSSGKTLSLPFEADVDVVAVLDSMLAASAAASDLAKNQSKKKNKRAAAADIDSDASSSSSEDEEQEQESKRRRRKGRSGSKKK